MTVYTCSNLLHTVQKWCYHTNDMWSHTIEIRMLSGDQKQSRDQFLVVPFDEYQWLMLDMILLQIALLILHAYTHTTVV